MTRALVRCIHAPAVAIAVAAGFASPSHAAVVSSAILKTFFQTGDFPTQAQFAITSPTGDPDSLHAPDFAISRAADGSHTFTGQYFGAGVVSDGAGIIPLSPGTVVGDTSSYALIDSLLHRISDRDLIGLRIMIGGQPHYGYMDLEVQAPLPGETTFGLTVYGWAYESNANTPITVTPVPSPAAGGVLLAFGALAARRRR